MMTHGLFKSMLFNLHVFVKVCPTWAACSFMLWQDHSCSCRALVDGAVALMAVKTALNHCTPWGGSGWCLAGREAEVQEWAGLSVGHTHRS